MPDDRLSKYVDLFDGAFYLDPNDVGDPWFATVGPLLLFAKRVVIHNPAGGRINDAHNTVAFGASCLDSKEVLDAATQVDESTGTAMLAFTAFKTFLEPEYRAKLPLAYQVTTDLDRAIISGSVKVAVPDGLPREESAKTALRLNPTIEDKIQGLISQHQQRIQLLPNRYSDVLDGKFIWPDSLKEGVSSLPPASQVSVLARFDFENDTVMRKLSRASVHYLSHPGEVAASAVHGLRRTFRSFREPNGPNAGDDLNTQDRFIRTIVDTAIGSNNLRLTLKDIIEFRRNHREEWLEDMRFILDNAQEIDDVYARLRFVRLTIMKRMSGRSGRQLPKGVRSTMPTALNWELSHHAHDSTAHAGLAPTNDRAIHVGRQVPQWAYWIGHRRMQEVDAE